MTLESFTNGELFNLQEPLKQLANVDVPARVGIRIARLIRAIAREIEPINEVRNKLILKYGGRDEKGGLSVGADSPNFAQFVEEHDALMKGTTEVEFDIVALPEDVKVDVKVLVALEPFLTIEDTPNVSPDGVVKEIPVATS